MKTNNNLKINNHEQSYFLLQHVSTFERKLNKFRKKLNKQKEIRSRLHPQHSHLITILNEQSTRLDEIKEHNSSEKNTNPKSVDQVVRELDESIHQSLQMEKEMQDTLIEKDKELYFSTSKNNDLTNYLNHHRYVNHLYGEKINSLLFDIEKRNQKITLLQSIYNSSQEMISYHNKKLTGLNNDYNRIANQVQQKEELIKRFKLNEKVAFKSRKEKNELLATLQLKVNTLLAQLGNKTNHYQDSSLEETISLHLNRMEQDYSHLKCAKKDLEQFNIEVYWRGINNMWNLWKNDTEEENQQKLAHITEVIEEVEKNLEEYKELFKQLNETIQSNEEKNTSLQDFVQELQDTISIYQQKQEHYQLEIEQLTKQIEEFKSVEEQKQQETTRLEEELKSFKDQQSQYDKNVNHYKQQIKNLEKQKNDYHKKINSLTRKLKEFKAHGSNSTNSEILTTDSVTGNSSVREINYDDLKQFHYQPMQEDSNSTVFNPYKYSQLMSRGENKK